MDILKERYSEQDPESTEGVVGDRQLPDLKDETGSIGDALRQDPSNLGDDVHPGADRTFPDTPISDKTM